MFETPVLFKFAFFLFKMPEKPGAGKFPPLVTLVKELHDTASDRYFLTLSK